MGVRGWIAALRLKDGQLVWKAYSNGPDKDVLIGPDYKPFYDKERGKDLGVTTWPPGAWQQGGGTVWGWIAYDPDLKLICHGTGNPGPWNQEARPGSNHWTTGIFARNADTGGPSTSSPREDRGLRPDSPDDPLLHELRIDLQLVGDDGANPPLAEALARRGLAANLRGYMVYGDYSQPNPPARILDAVASGASTSPRSGDRWPAGTHGTRRC